MVSFATLILTLVTGIVPVEVMVDHRTVASVEVRLDGETIGRLDGPPWLLDVDFGAALQPHELTAVARDAQGRELSRARQMVNLPRPPAELALTLDRGPDDLYRTARVAWDIVGDSRVPETRALFDGSPIPVASPQRIELPRYDPAVQHHLVVQVLFQEDVQAEVAVALGGQFGATSHTEITSLVVALRDGHDALPDGSLDGWFRKHDRALRVAAVERPPAAIVLVRDLSSEARLAVLGHELRRHRVLIGGNRSRDGVRPDDAVYLLDTVPRLADRDDGLVPWLFPMSPDLAHHGRRRGVTHVLSGLRFGERNRGSTRPAQAVATAGLQAAGLGRPRLVILAVGPTATDSGLYTPRNVRQYLEALQVPFRLWSFGDDGRLARKWSDAVSIKDYRDLRAAVDELRAVLDRQRIVWLEGRHLPQRIELSAEARKVIELAGRL